jgi:hypothetical protein
VKPLVRAVRPALPPSSACRWCSLAPDSSQARNAVPICTPSASRASAATTPRASAIPHAVTTGTWTTSATCGTGEKVPVSDSSDDRKKEPRCPPASKPEATTTSTPASCRATASSGVVAVPIVTIPCIRHSSRTSRGGMPKVKLKAGTFASRTTRTWSSKRVGAFGL